MNGIKSACLLFIVMSFLTGVLYPFVVTGVAQALFPWRANGSLIQSQKKLIGSKWIGQSFTSPDYFWGRPSATPLFAYQADHSSGSNLGPLNPDLMTTVSARIALLRQADPGQKGKIPVDLVTASASGLDPDISPVAALYQVHRVAMARHLPVVEVSALVGHHIHGRWWGMLGEPVVNVLELNLALDELKKGT